MSVREHPKTFIYNCDVRGCSCRHLAQQGGHYTNSTPPGWLTITAKSIRQHGAIGFNDALLCPAHSYRFLQATWDLRSHDDDDCFEHRYEAPGRIKPPSEGREEGCG